MRLYTPASQLVAALTIGLILILSQVGECHRDGLLGSGKGKVELNLVVHSHGLEPQKHLPIVLPFHFIGPSLHPPGLVTPSPGPSHPSTPASRRNYPSPPLATSPGPASSSDAPLAPSLFPPVTPSLLPSPSTPPPEPTVNKSPPLPSPVLPPPSNPPPPTPVLSLPSNASTPPPSSKVLSPPPSPLPSPPPPPVLSSPPIPPPVATSGLQVGFYKGKCSNRSMDIEAIIASEVQAHFDNDSSILPAILRMQFHDCFVRGCDASILIAGISTEKTAGPNFSVRGYDFIGALKVAVEAVCPGVVSCSDIIAIATKVLIKLGGGPDYPVQTGRRDGVESKAGDADANLPSPFLSVNDTVAVFVAKKITKEEMVVLLGCHTVGVAHCGFYQGRLYPGTSLFDPNMDRKLREQLIPTCPQGPPENTVASLDQGPKSSNTVDNSFFTQILNQRGILPIDQALARDPKTQGFILQLSLNATLFNIELANAMVKLQALEVLTGNQGQIRKVCSKIN